MAGIRQHYIPKFLLKGFSSKVKKKLFFSWQFLKHKEPIERNISTIGFSKKFYGEPGIGTLDETITKLEGELSSSINKIKFNKKITSHDLPSILRFVEHMIIRTRYTRLVSKDAITSLFQMGERVLSDHEKCSSIINDHINKNRNLINIKLEYKIRKELESICGKSNQKMQNIIIKQSMEMFPFIANSCIDIFSNTTSQLMRDMIEHIDVNADLLHNDNLSKFLKEDMSLRIAKYNNMYWDLLLYNKNSLILGDICVLEMDVQYQTFLPSFFQRDKESLIIIPIAHNILLFGSHSKRNPVPDAETINMNSSKLSAEFFISSTKSHREMNYHSNLAMNYSWWNNEIIEIENQYK
ncbi:DUF4238 domain-containing protein [Desulfonatronum parangueonense]